MAKLSWFSRFSGVLQKFFREFKYLSLIVLNNEHLRQREHESISVKTSMAPKPQIFSPANLSPSMGILVVEIKKEKRLTSATKVRKQGTI